MADLIQSLNNLTPRGLETIFGGDTNLDTILLSGKPRSDAELHYMLFMWNGRQATQLTKAIALAKGFQLDGLMAAKESVITKFLFEGGVIQGPNVQRSAPIPLISNFDNDGNPGVQIENPVFLLKILCAEQPAPLPPQQPLFPRFRQYFLGNKPRQERKIELPVENPTKPSFSLNLRQEPPKMPSLSLGGGKQGIPSLNIQPKEEIQVPIMQRELPDKPSIGLNLQNVQTREDEWQRLQAQGNIAQIDDDWMIRDTNRVNLKFEKFSKQCSELYPNLFVGSDLIARNLQELQTNGITHIVNCAGNVCANYFPEQLTYFAMFLKDAPFETIDSVFYQCIDFIENAIQNGGKVFVHCMQGVSRSVTICLAYIIFKQKIEADIALADAREIRGICSPNWGFLKQLKKWYQRLYLSYEEFENNPRVYCIGSHQPEQPSRIIARMMSTPTHVLNEDGLLDPRTIFISHTKNKIYLWQGDEILEANQKPFMQTAQYFISKLQQFEGAGEVTLVKKGEETEEFWNNAVPQQVVRKYIYHEGLDFMFVDQGKAEDEEVQALNQSVDEEDEELTKRPKLYIYPEVLGIGIFDEEELTPDALLVLCEPKVRYIWQGKDFIEDDYLSKDEFIKESSSRYYQANEIFDTKIEAQDDESDRFLELFGI